MASEPTPHARSLAAVAAVAKAATAYDRPDLAAKAEAIGQVISAGATVVVAGDFKRGKSALVNALLQTDVCDTEPATVADWPTHLRHGAPSRVAHVRWSVHGDTEAIVDPDLAHLRRRGAVIERLEATLDHPLLAAGVTVVDTPAAAGVDTPAAIATWALSQHAALVVVVTDATQPLTAPEVELLETVAAAAPTALVHAKVDLAPHGARVVDEDRRTVAAQGIEVAAFAVATPLRVLATRGNDRALNDESGYPALIEHLRATVVEPATKLVAERAGAQLFPVVAELHATLERRRDAAADPETAGRHLAELEAARDQAEALRASSTRWQRELNEGVADLNAELEALVRDRARMLHQLVDDAIDQIDPVRDWGTFEPWWRSQCTALLDEAFRRTEAGLSEIADDVNAIFAEAELDVAVLLDGWDHDPSSRIDGLLLDERVLDERASVLGGGLAAIRGSYSGVLMFGMMGTMVGFAMLNPVTIAVGAGLGAKAIVDERQRSLARRRSEATTAVRGHTEQILTSVRTELRRETTRTQRRIRDELTEIAQQLQRAAEQALRTAREDRSTAEAERRRLVADLDAELARVGALRSRVTELGAPT